MVSLKDKYANGKYPRPGSIETEEDYLKIMEHFYSLYSSDLGSIPYDGRSSSNVPRRSIKTLRDYARGVISSAKYREKFDIVDNKGEGLTNISYQGIDVFGKFRNIIKDKIMSTMLDIDTYAIDEDARKERSLKRSSMKLMANPATKAFLQQSSYQPEDDMGFQSPEEVDLYEALGGIRLAYEMAMKDAVDKTIHAGDFDVITELIAEDIIDINRFAIDFKIKDGKLTAVYVDPQKVVSRPSVYPDNNDADFMGYRTYENVSGILRSDPSVDADHLNRRVTVVRNTYGSTIRDIGEREDYISHGSYINHEEGFDVEVLNMYFTDVVVKRFVKGRHKRGSFQFEEVDADFKLSKRAKGKEIVERRIPRLYKCRWVVGTDVVYDYGLVGNQVKVGPEGERKILFPMVFYVKNEPSLAEKCIAHIDDINMTVFSIRNTFNNLPPAPRMVINANAINDSFKIGDDEFTILDATAEFQKRGIMIVSTKEDYDVDPNGSNRLAQKPIDFVSTGIIEDINAFFQNIQFSIDQIRQITGVNEVADGTNTHPDMLKSVQEGLMASTNSALRPYISMYVNGFKRMANFVSMFYVRAIKYDFPEAKYLPISEEIKRKIRSTKEIADHEWGVEIRIADPKQKDLMLANLMKRESVIPPQSFYIVYNAIQSGDYKRAQIIMARVVSEAESTAHQRNMEIAQAQSRGNAEAAQVSEKEKRETLVTEYQFKERILQLEAKIRAVEVEQEKNNAKELKEHEVMLLTQKELKVVEANNRNRLEQ